MPLRLDQAGPVRKSDEKSLLLTNEAEVDVSVDKDDDNHNNKDKNNKHYALGRMIRSSKGEERRAESVRAWSAVEK